MTPTILESIARRGWEAADLYNLRNGAEWGDISPTFQEGILRATKDVLAGREPEGLWGAFDIDQVVAFTSAVRHAAGDGGAP